MLAERCGDASSRSHRRLHRLLPLRGNWPMPGLVCARILCSNEGTGTSAVSLESEWCAKCVPAWAWDPCLPVLLDKLCVNRNMPGMQQQSAQASGWSLQIGTSPPPLFPCRGMARKYLLCKVIIVVISKSHANYYIGSNLTQW